MCRIKWLHLQVCSRNSFGEKGWFSMIFSAQCATNCKFRRKIKKKSKIFDLRKALVFKYSLVYRFWYVWSNGNIRNLELTISAIDENLNFFSLKFFLIKIFSRLIFCAKIFFAKIFLAEIFSKFFFVKIFLAKIFSN